MLSATIFTSDYNNLLLSFSNLKIKRLYKESSLPILNKVYLRLYGRSVNSNFLSRFIYCEDLSVSQDVIIIFDGGCTINAIEQVKSKNRNNRIILWYWNPIKNMRYIPPSRVEGIEKWSYSPNDCRQYGLKYNTPFYFNYPCCGNYVSDDVFFIGRDKGRYSEIIRYKRMLESYGLKCNIKITPDKNFNRYLSYKQYSPTISYAQTLDIVGSSRALLDVYEDLYSPLSLRTMEALCYKKKLITNNLAVKNYDFYNPLNIFILGLDDPAEIKNFVFAPYAPIEPDIVKYYSFDSWLNRMLEA